MVIADYLLAGLVAMLTGLDRVALVQVMISRPLVAAPLTGLVLGNPLLGLEVGMLLELLWLGRLPVGAAIPPDDTQVAVGATVLAFSMGQMLGLGGMPMVILAVLVAIPLGKFGQIFDRLARNVNDRLAVAGLKALGSGNTNGLERRHLMGLISFAVSSLATACVIVLIGSVVLFYTAPQLIGAVRDTGLSLQYSLIIVGAASLLGTINVNRSISLFCAAFSGTLLVLWMR
ncbi:MAG: PTS sugar transporter subunit IIC [Desulfuromonadales bacterium]|jgi:PTS system mannose-specific IIC component|nr:PTS sugar transporter subunit IIC [Desulfuromonadales bacterium]MDH3807606.1 PTS sugar transporter subunit IIC [Desulfuromonadales bacterium]MDH3868319.1 PTS sugar transporter subunit IIC [Desulfuromonadales bacterium]MDH4024209.1 PTS sugar transporter subunit IIC [Desulfuromonadales bacterium]